MTDAELAARLAEAAGEVLLAIRGSELMSGAPLGRAGDAAANAVIVEALTQHRPDDCLLSEERECDGARLGEERVWIVDPLDGTREYSEGRDDWAVHVALAIDGKARVGAVALPARGLVLRSDQPQPLSQLGQPLRLLVSRTRAPALVERVAATLGAELVPMGSAGAKAMAVVLGEGDAYVHSGGQHQWDNCAPVAVATAYGLVCERLDGSPLVYNGQDTLVPDLLICRHECTEQVRAAIRRAI